MNTRGAVRVEIHKLKTLPPLPEATRKILLAINDPTLSLERLAEVLEENPSLVARLLGLANSAYFGKSGKIHTLQDAVIQVLGLNLVKSITSSMLLRDFLETKKCKAFDGGRFWYCALLTALLAQDLAAYTEVEPKIQGAVAHAAGLIVNIGLLALVYTFPDAMEQVFYECTETDRSVSDILQEWSGLDQYQVGSWLVQRWQLPEVYARVIAEHKNADYSGEDAELVKLVAVCASMAGKIFEEPDQATSLDRTSDDGLDISTTDLNRVLRRNSKRLEQIVGALPGP